MLIVESSHRSVNGTYLADMIAAKYTGAERLRLSEIKFSGCTACKKCRENDSTCVMQDDLSPVLAKLPEEKQIVLIAPNYMGFMNGEMKLFMDRLYCMRRPNKQSRFAEGTKLAFFLTQGSGNRGKGELCQGWLKTITEHYAVKFYGHTLPNCSDDNTDGVRLKQEEIMMNLGFFF